MNDLQSTLAMNLGKASFNLSVESFPRPEPGSTHFDTLAFGTKSLTIAKSQVPEAKQTLWSQNGWQQISKSDFERRAKHAGTAVATPATIWMWSVFLLFAMLWRFGALGHGLLTLLGMKGRVLKNMATSYSFPPVTPAQFPALDVAALERYTREFESMGFVRLLDFSLVSNAPNPIPSFCRLYAHTKYQCFGEISQILPRGKAPLPLACSIQSVLQDGWTLTFSDRKPMGRGIGATKKKGTLGFYAGNRQFGAAAGLFADAGPRLPGSEHFHRAGGHSGGVHSEGAAWRDGNARGGERKGLRDGSLPCLLPQAGATKDEYTWLGDYPKEAERRKQGFPTPARAS